MVKNLCFFRVGFAHNSLVRMRFYEKILPKEVKLFLFTTNKYESSEEIRKKWDLKRTEIIIEKYNPFTLPFKLREFCKKNEISRIINVGNYLGGIPSLLASAFTKTDYIVSINGDPFNFDRLKFYVDWLLLFPIINFSNKTIFVSRYALKDAKNFYPEEKLFELSAPIDTDLFKKKSKSLSRKKLKIKKSDKVLIYVGRISKAKGSEILSDLIKMNPDKKFLLIGKIMDKEFPKDSKNVLHFSNINNEKLPEYYSTADLCLFFSKREGFGIAPREAMSCELPILLSNIRAFKHIKPAIKIPFNARKIQEEIENFFKLPESEKIKLGKDCRNFVMEESSYEVLKDKYLKYYLE